MVETNGAPSKRYAHQVDASECSSARRGIWTFLDLSVSSGSNFLLSVIVARTLDARSFGAFAAVLSCYFLALEASRALAAEPALSRPVYSNDEAWALSTSALAGFVILIGILGSAILTLVGILSPPDTRNAIFLLGVLLPFLLVQDICRYVFFSDGNPRKALLSDLLWFGAQSIGLGYLLAVGSTSLPAFIGAWGISGTIAGGLALLQARCLPNLRSAWTWFRRYKDLAGPLLLEFIVNRGSTQLVLLSLASIAGLPALAVFAGSRLLMGPFTILQVGSTAFGLPEAVRIKSNPGSLARFARLLSVGLAAFLLIYAGALWLIPANLGPIVFGEIWDAAHGLLPLTALWMGLDALSQGPRIALRALENAKGALRARVFASPVVLMGGITGAALGAAHGTAIGLACALALTAAIWWHQFLKGLSTQPMVDDRRVSPVK